MEQDPATEKSACVHERGVADPRRRAAGGRGSAAGAGVLVCSGPTYVLFLELMSRQFIFNFSLGSTKLVGSR